MIQGIVAALMSGPQSDIFSDFHDQAYDAIMDKILLTRHGKMTVDEDMATADDSSMADMAIYAYLTERAIYIRQNLAYEAAEYNPIENYSQIEHEVTTVEIGEREHLDTHTDKAHTFSTEHEHGAQDQTNTHTKEAYEFSIEHEHGAQDQTNKHTEEAHEVEIRHDIVQHKTDTHTPQIITESYTEADVVSEVTQLQSTHETQAAPDDSDSYHAKEKVLDNPGKTTNTEKPYNRKTKTPDNTVSVTEAAHLDTDKEIHNEDEVTTDQLTTTLYTDTDTEKHDADEVTTDRLETTTYTDTVTERHLADEIQTDKHQAEAAEDETTRDLTRSGNIGVQTAAQMMALDKDFWEKNLWLRQLCLDIVNLICERTVAAL